MVIAVQDVGTGLIKSTEAYRFIRSQSKDDMSANELRISTLAQCIFLHFMEQNHYQVMIQVHND